MLLAQKPLDTNAGRFEPDHQVTAWSTPEKTARSRGAPGLKP